MAGRVGEKLSGATDAARSWPSLGGDHGRLIRFVIAGLFVVGEKGGQRVIVSGGITID
jgi:hypothetical protein